MNSLSMLVTLSRLRELPCGAATVQLKSNLEDPSEIDQYLSALANAAELVGYEQGSFPPYPR